MPLIATQRGEIFIADHRKDDRPPLLLVHGAGGSRLDWPGDLRRMPEANAIAIDLPGHGKSPGTGRDEIGAYAGDIVALLDALDTPQSVVMGHSMGGAIAQQLAVDHSARVAGLVLIGTGARLRVHPDILDRIQSTQDEVAARLSQWMWSPQTPAETRDVTREQVMNLPAAVVHGDYLACDRFDLRDRLAEITAPALVIGGTADQMTPFKYSEYLAAHIPNVTLVSIEDGGHMMMLEQPQAVANAVQQWLKQIRGNA